MFLGVLSVSAASPPALFVVVVDLDEHTAANTIVIPSDARDLHLNATRLLGCSAARLRRRDAEMPRCRGAEMLRCRDAEMHLLFFIVALQWASRRGRGRGQRARCSRRLARRRV